MVQEFEESQAEWNTTHAHAAICQECTNSFVMMTMRSILFLSKAEVLEATYWAGAFVWCASARGYILLEGAQFTLGQPTPKKKLKQRLFTL